MFELVIIYCMIGMAPSASTCDSFNFMEWFPSKIQCEAQLDKFLNEDRAEIEEEIVPDGLYLYNVGCRDNLKLPIHPRLTI